MKKRVGKPDQGSKRGKLCVYVIQTLYVSKREAYEIEGIKKTVSNSISNDVSNDGLNSGSNSGTNGGSNGESRMYQRHHSNVNNYI